jgi:hypothetical protein
MINAFDYDRHYLIFLYPNARILNYWSGIKLGLKSNKIEELGKHS